MDKYDEVARQTLRIGARSMCHDLRERIGVQEGIAQIAAILRSAFPTGEAGGEVESLVDYCINLGQSYYSGQIDLEEARDYIRDALSSRPDEGMMDHAKAEQIFRGLMAIIDSDRPEDEAAELAIALIESSPPPRPAESAKTVPYAMLCEINDGHWSGEMLRSISKRYGYTVTEGKEGA